MENNLPRTASRTGGRARPSLLWATEVTPHRGHPQEPPLGRAAAPASLQDMPCGRKHHS